MRLITILFFCILFGKIYGQQFAPNSAVWNYTYNYSLGTHIGYYKFTVIGDTLLQSKSCKIIEKRNIGFNSVNQTYYNNVDGIEYVYSDTDKVYYFRFNQFFTLYNFAATAGTSWIIAGDNLFPNDSLAKVVVDSVGLQTINTINLRTLFLHTDSGSFSFIGNKIIEKIGDNTYMFPIRINITGPDWPGPLRCYYDNSFGLFQNISVSCDTLYNRLPIINRSDYNVKIYPNPVNSVSTLDWNGNIGENYTLNIYNYLGKMVKIITTNSPAIEIFKSDFVKGIYFYRLTSNKEQISVGQFEIN